MRASYRARDLAMEMVAVNMPGTDREHPNRRRKLRLPVQTPRLDRPKRSSKRSGANAKRRPAPGRAKRPDRWRRSLRAAMRRGGGNTLATWNRALALTFKGGLLTTKVNMDKEHVKGAAQQSAGDIKNARRKAADSIKR